MLPIDYFLTALEIHIVASQTSSHLISTAEGIFLLDSDLILTPNTIFVGSVSAFADLAGCHSSFEQCTFFLCDGRQNERFSVPEYPDCNVIITDLPLATLYNQLFSLYRKGCLWESQLIKESSHGLSHMIRFAARELDSSVCMIDYTQKFVYSAFRSQDQNLLLTDEDNFTNEVQGYLNTYLLEKHSSCICFSNENSRHVIADLPVDDRTIGYLYAYCKEQPIVITSLMLLLRQAVISYLSKNHASDSQISFHVFAERLFLSEVTDYGQMQLLLPRLKASPEKYMRIINVILDQPEEDTTQPRLHKLFKSLQAYFSPANMTIIGTEIIILISSKVGFCPVTQPREMMEEILAAHGAAAIISYVCTSAKALRINYQKTQMMFPLVHSIRLDNADRFIHFGRYNPYLIIDICAKSMNQHLDTDDIIYLCPPGILTLTRYDQTYSSDLRDVLFHYLIFDRSIADTAKVMYMHRNTVINKLNKIKDLLNYDFEDPYYRFHLLFSCMLIRYYENHQNKNLSLSPFVRDDYK